MAPRLQHWDYLPVELQEEVLLRVHWHDLCRCRAVRMEWNYMITQPRFVTLHATTPRPESCVVTTTRKDMPLSEIDPTPVTDENDQWQLLDIAANRVLSIPDTFIRTSLLPGGRGIHFLRCTIAASGGLVYALYKADNDLRSPLRHVVCNPATKNFHQIPAPPGGYFLDPVAMVVDVEESTLRYRIVYPRIFGNARLIAGEVHLYDSRVRVWRKLCDAPAAAHFPCSCVVLDGVFYAVYEGRQNRRHELYSCDLETGEWRLIDVSLPRPPPRPQMIMSCSQVVAAAGRLFFVGYSGPESEAGAVITVTIWRITLGERPRLTLVAQLPSFMPSDGLCEFCLVKFVVVVTGCGDSIVVSNFHGHRVRWDVVRGTWHHSLTPFLPKMDGAACHSCHGFFVGTMDLEMRQMPPQ